MLALIGFLTAAAASVPLAPADGIYDDAHLLSAAVHGSLASEIRSFGQETGIRLLLSTNTYLPADVTISVHGRSLLKAWKGNDPAVLICAVRSSTVAADVQPSEELWDRYTEPEVLGALRQASTILRDGTLNEDQLVAGARLLMQRLRTIHEERQARQQLLHKTDLQLLAAFIGCLVLAAGITGLLVRRVGRHESLQAVKTYFPDAVVSQRLGAPCGGGVSAEISLRRD